MTCGTEAVHEIQRHTVYHPVCGCAGITEQGMNECMENISYYMENARVIAETLRKKNIPFTGGVNSPYIWFKCPNGMESWELFDHLLENIQVVGTPGAGFGCERKESFPSDVIRNP